MALLTKQHLTSLLSLTQFGRCWGIIESHLELYRQIEVAGIKRVDDEHEPADKKTDSNLWSVLSVVNEMQTNM